MLLQNLIADSIADVIASPNIDDIKITGITDNSKDTKEGYLFVAVKGYSSDGHEYIEEAIRKGARAVIGEKPMVYLAVPYIQVSNSRRILGAVAKQFYKDPSSQKIMIGVTGTNGKTTISYMLRQILEENGVSCSVIGTIQYMINGETIESRNTTPGNVELNALLAKSEDQAVILEVSSHGLAQYRLEGIEFDYCIFTNLYHEHLDFHQTMEGYFHAKAMLFDKLKSTGLAIINGDNEWGERLIKNLHEKRVNTYVIGTASHSDLQITDFQSAPNPSISMYENGVRVNLAIPLPGHHNLYNAAIAYAVTRRMSIRKQEILPVLEHFSGVPGRFEIYRDEDGPTMVIDYAHTADAIFHALQTAKQCGAMRIFHIFGFRGGRDQTKRAEMVKVSSEMSDVSILTMDDLDSEASDEMVASLHTLHHDYAEKKDLVIPDRTIAIKTAIKMGKKDDWIVITGKGPESYKQPFALPTQSDKETVLYLQEKIQRAIQ
ncbi:UDP-N-acetylmuramoylalanyl-D-glutamate--2,6-diaminopimelate ligase [Bacillus oleivorans]|uniref:UDP-N-acetylmuramyl-tripeptide synthetase n=1 Tax=Bacillus oleivorans TaxID=1448271 RepID=A0A285CZJ2_9BACI|nr:UDP-N-acetylmuramoyl-L-alanyl-D-glutamate--2,6-diaminopimelate ligase [Bacillus oleivorans]SNX72488.1 UDP-N-acetylmuramoylalanyl-D-glutamate--2,6-diaminopimelate ligase [Bacillus oleivorans]